MTAYEIENSGVYESSKFTVTLKNGDIIQFWGEYTGSGFPKFFEYSSDYNILQSDYYFDSKGRHDQHIGIKGEDILNIKVLVSKVESEKTFEKSQGYWYLVLAIMFIIGLYQSCH